MMIANPGCPVVRSLLREGGIEGQGFVVACAIQKMQIVSRQAKFAVRLSKYNRQRGSHGMKLQASVKLVDLSALVASLTPARDWRRPPRPKSHLLVA
jgi:hypothetical protein